MPAMQRIFDVGGCGMDPAIMLFGRIYERGDVHMLKKLMAAVAVAFLLGACETPAPPPPPPAPPPVRNFLVFFDFDKSSLTPRAMDIVKEAANVAKQGQNTRVTCTGHTDTAGPAAYNMAL